MNPDTCSHLHILLTPQQPSHSTAPKAHDMRVQILMHMRVQILNDSNSQTQTTGYESSGKGLKGSLAF